MVMFTGSGIGPASIEAYDRLNDSACLATVLFAADNFSEAVENLRRGDRFLSCGCHGKKNKTAEDENTFEQAGHSSFPLRVNF